MKKRKDLIVGWIRKDYKERFKVQHYIVIYPTKSYYDLLNNFTESMKIKVEIKEEQK